MDIKLQKYSEKDYPGVLQLIKSEGEEWEQYTIPEYKINLEKCITHIALVNEKIVGYIRSWDDYGQFICVLDLLVHKDYRGYKIGKMLLNTVQEEYPKMEVYILSDNNEYYKKLGYKVEGSIFKIV